MSFLFIILSIFLTYYYFNSKLTTSNYKINQTNLVLTES